MLPRQHAAHIGAHALQWLPRQAGMLVPASTQMVMQQLSMPESWDAGAADAPQQGGTCMLLRAAAAAPASGSHLRQLVGGTACDLRHTQSCQLCLQILELRVMQAERVRK